MNVVFILADQHAPQFTGCYGGITRTPHLDALAARGTRFQNAYCCSPICSPTRASLFSGRYVHEVGIWDNAVAYDGTPPGWPHYLREKNVALTTIGRLDFKPDCDLGIDDMRLPSLRISPDITSLFREMPIVERRAMRYEYYDLKPRPEGIGLLASDSEPTEAQVTTEAVEWINRERPTDQPWVLYVGYCTPHPKWKPQNALWKKYLGQVPQLAGKYSQPFDELHPADQRNATYSCGYHNQDDDEIRLLHAAYHAVMEEFDQEVGQLLGALEQQGILDDTLIIYGSDHGESARAHGNLGKCSMYEESIGIPLIVAGPGIGKGQTEPAVVSHLDIFATIADATELVHPSDLRGRSLLPLLRGQAELQDDPILIECHAGNTNNGVFAIRQGPWKLVEFLNESPALFNLAEDPDEMHDLVRHQPGSSQTRSVVESLRAALHAICDPAQVDATAKDDQHRLKEALITAGQLEQEVYQRGYQRSIEQLIPWEWEQFEQLHH